MTRPILRKLLNDALPTDDALEEVVGDHFPNVRASWTNGMTRVQKVTHLLDYHTVEEILEVLRGYRSTDSGPIRRLPPSARSLERFPSDVTYRRVIRKALAEEIIDNQLRYRRLATLLQTRAGGGKTLACQIAEQYTLRYDAPVVWLTDRACERSSLSDCYALLTDDGTVRNQPEFDAWLTRHIGPQGALIVFLGLHGPDGFLEEVASCLSSFRSRSSRTVVIIVGGERVLRMRRPVHYWWSHLLHSATFIDVPDLTPKEIHQLLADNQLPAERAPLYFACTKGHPGLLHELIRNNIDNESSADRKIYELIRSSVRFDEYLLEPKVRLVLDRLMRREEVLPLGNTNVRHYPDLCAEARLYFDGLLIADEAGKTALRCRAVGTLIQAVLEGKNQESIYQL